MSNSIVRRTDSNAQSSALVPPMTLRELKQAASKHFSGNYTICHLSHDYPLVAMLCDMDNPYSPHTTWLYVAQDDRQQYVIAKPRSGGHDKDIELTKLLTEIVLLNRKRREE